MKRIARILLSLLLIAGGVNHFVNPSFYLPLIPPYFPYPELLNFVSGGLEVALGLGLLWPSTRRWAGIGTVLLMIAFIPAHIYMIQQGGCLAPDLCFPTWFFWVRLFPGQFLLMGWAWWVSKP